jgi:hypothetical protein
MTEREMAHGCPATPGRSAKLTSMFTNVKQPMRAKEDLEQRAH